MESAIRLYEWNLKYAHALVTDLSDAACREPGGPGLENHPAWTIGHLASASDMLAEDLGESRDLSAEWRDLFERNGPGDPRLPDDRADAYPPMAALLGELSRQHVRVERAWREKLLSEDINALVKWRFDRVLPSLGDVVLYFATTHEAMHLGQLASWRRARKLSSAMASM